VSSIRQLVVNADDFGFTPDVNDGILHAHINGILTATTLMATGSAFDHAVTLARQHPSLDIGVHLQIVQGPSLSRPYPLPPTIPALIAALAAGHWDVDREFSLQIEKILASGLRPTHLDTHKHTHLHPKVLAAVARASSAYNIPFVRRPFDLPVPAPLSTRLTIACMRTQRGNFERTLARDQARSTGHFIGFAWTGNFTAATLLEHLPNLPPGSTEFMCHPGFCREPLRAARTRLKQSREQELAALTDPAVRRCLVSCGIELTNYAGLASNTASGT
jgi:chitin disaccharide deacetylase